MRVLAADWVAAVEPTVNLLIAVTAMLAAGGGR